MNIKSVLAQFSWGVLATCLCFASTPSLGEELKPYDGRCESPCPPEVLASFLDALIDRDAENVSLTLVHHLQPEQQPSGDRAMWVCEADGRPLWVVAGPPRKADNKTSGLTAAAIRRARTFLAEHQEMKGTETLRNESPQEETLRPDYQRKHYGLQITHIQLLDRKTESWAITAQPIVDSLGGEIWMRFDRGHEISAEFGR